MSITKLTDDQLIVKVKETLGQVEKIQEEMKHTATTMVAMARAMESISNIEKKSVYLHKVLQYKDDLERKKLEVLRLLQASEQQSTELYTRTHNMVKEISYSKEHLLKMNSKTIPFNFSEAIRTKYPEIIRKRVCFAFFTTSFADV